MKVLTSPLKNLNNLLMTAKLPNKIQITNCMKYGRAKKMESARTMARRLRMLQKIRMASKQLQVNKLPQNLCQYQIKMGQIKMARNK